jgi:hypothetical protein
MLHSLLPGHVLKARIVSVYEEEQYVASYVAVSCSCGWTTGEQPNMAIAVGIASTVHPEARMVQGASE